MSPNPTPHDGSDPPDTELHQKTFEFMNGGAAGLSPQRETDLYLGHQTVFEMRDRLNEVTARSGPIMACIHTADLPKVRWDGGVLGEFNPDREEAVRKGVRHQPYAEIAPLSFNSATFGVPVPEGAKTAWVVANEMNSWAHTGDQINIERLVSSVARTAFETLCTHYGLDPDRTVTLFDDNASLAFFQTLGSLRLPPDATILSFYNTGRVMPEAMQGKNVFSMPSNFVPNIDIWSNADLERAQAAAGRENIGSFRLIQLGHENEHYGSNADIVGEILRTVDTHRPDVISINSVTRLGRRIQFVDVCQQIRQKYDGSDYDPIIILDDAQGFTRLERARYFSGAHNRRVESIWDYADGIVVTGAKALGALMGSGAMLLNKERFEARRLPEEESPALYRARRYGLVSRDFTLMEEHNRVAPGVVNAPELASFTSNLQTLPIITDELRTRLRTLRELIVSGLREIEGVQVVENRNAQYIDGIVGFCLTGAIATQGKLLKEKLATPRHDHDQWGALPITIPALIRNGDTDYLRISLDTRPLENGSYGEYKNKVQYLLRCIREAVGELRQEAEKRTEESDRLPVREATTFLFPNLDPLDDH